MKKPYVIAINSVSGGGKTALARSVQNSLPGSILFCFDDFGEPNAFDEDPYDWWQRGANLSEFNCQDIHEAVHQEIQRRTADFIILDYPFGRDHPQFQNLIDLSVFIDTPLDVAMARRILRDHQARSGESAEDVVKRLHEGMAYYIEKGRYPYLDTERHKANCDLILNGCHVLETLRDLILERIRAERSVLF